MNVNASFFIALLFRLSFHLVGADTVNDQLGSIFIRLYGESMDEYIDASLDNVLSLFSKMKADWPTVLYVHGYTESADSESAKTVANAYVQRGDHNVLIADYRNISSLRYALLATSASKVGSALALALNEMVLAGLNADKIHVVGHSLGAQVASHIGKHTSFQLPRITGLDPAGPLFNIIEDHLSSADAGFVDIIHTDYGLYGITRTVGTVDFFPNGGHRVQPGCPYSAFPFSDEDFCSHKRSWKFYAESVTNEGSFIARKCSSFYRFVAGECDGDKSIEMGFAVPSNAKGSFYLVTGGKSPFGLKEAGMRA